MSYCNPNWNGDGKLSDLDIQAGPKPSMANHEAVQRIRNHRGLV